MRSGTLYLKFTDSVLQAFQTSPIVEPGPKVLISSVCHKERTIGSYVKDFGSISVTEALIVINDIKPDFKWHDS